MARSSEVASPVRTGSAGGGIWSFLITDRLWRQAAKWLIPLVPRGVTPNQLTIARAALGITAGAAASLARLWRGWFVVSVLLILASWVADCLDGELARTRGLTSQRGYYVDRLSDGLAKIAIYLGIATSGYAHFEIVIFAPLVETLNDVVSAHRLLLTGQENGAPFGVALVLLMLTAPMIATALFPMTIVTVGPLALGWLDVAFLIGMTVSASEMTISAVRLYHELAPT